ncbi:RlpA-like double-psi beta-barrel-protein domain-containing protein-containing protein [Aspergillus carlsbadensis]|nr:RlpA-like double-psi beta-barrel-protein domain-containing protein-containing protein [Aspergillus carlsbadensis]
MTTPAPSAPSSGVPKRKPLPTVVAAPAPSTDSSSDLEKSTAEPGIIFAPAAQPAAAATAFHQPRQWPGQSQWNALQSKWSFYSAKKKRIILGALAAILVLLALIIGLAVGLTQRHGKGSDSNADNVSNDDDSSSNLPLPTSNGGPYTGDLTYYDPGLGSCGITSTSSEKICAISHVLFDATMISANPNTNPICGNKLRIRRGGKTVDVTVVDRCPGCNTNDLDVSSTVFEELGDLAEGRVLIDWSWLEATPAS